MFCPAFQVQCAAHVGEFRQNFLHAQDLITEIFCGSKQDLNGTVFQAVGLVRPVAYTVRYKLVLLQCLGQWRGMSSILLAVIGSEVFVFNDVESLDQEPLRIII